MWVLPYLSGNAEHQQVSQGSQVLLPVEVLQHVLTGGAAQRGSAEGELRMTSIWAMKSVQRTRPDTGSRSRHA